MKSIAAVQRLLRLFHRMLALACFFTTVGFATASCDDAYDGPAMVEKAASTGKPGTAQVLSGRDTNNRKDVKKFFAFRMVVTPDDGTPPFTEELQTLMDPLEASRVLPGSSAKIKYVQGKVSYFVFR